MEFCAGVAWQGRFRCPCSGRDLHVPGRGEWISPRRQTRGDALNPTKKRFERDPAHAFCVALVLSCVLFDPGGFARAECVPDAVGLALSLGNNERGTLLGDALGQTFRAVDTLITRITVWRPANNVNSVGTHLFVTTVDTVQVPPRPITQGIIQDGPSVYVRDDSGNPGQPIRMDFILDPPLALPHPGIYAFFLRRDGCDLGETRIVASTAVPRVVLKKEVA
jgi:hypothetical protein